MQVGLQKSHRKWKWQIFTTLIYSIYRYWVQKHCFRHLGQEVLEFLGNVALNQAICGNSVCRGKQVFWIQSDGPCCNSLAIRDAINDNQLRNMTAVFRSCETVNRTGCKNPMIVSWTIHQKGRKGLFVSTRHMRALVYNMLKLQKRHITQALHCSSRSQLSKTTEIRDGKWWSRQTTQIAHPLHNAARGCFCYIS